MIDETPLPTVISYLSFKYALFCIDSIHIDKVFVENNLMSQIYQTGLISL